MLIKHFATNFLPIVEFEMEIAQQQSRLCVFNAALCRF